MQDMTRISDQPADNEGVQRLLRGWPALLIEVEWVKSSHGKSLPVYDPSTGREIATIVDASDADADRAVAAARATFDDGRWSGLAPYAPDRVIKIGRAHV